MKEFVKNKVYPLSLFLIPIVLVNATKFIVPAIALWVVASFFHFQKPVWKEIPWIIYGILCFFILHVIGLINTENLGYAGKDLETKLSFAIFPVIYIFTYKNLKLEAISWGKWGFVVASGFAMLHSFIKAYLCDSSGYGACYAPHVYGFQMHGTYLTAIYLFSAVLLIKWQKFNFVALILKVLYVLLLLVSLYYIRSLSSIVVVALLAIILWGRAIFKMKSWLLKISVILLPLMFLFNISRIEAVERDLDSTATTIENYIKDKDLFLENAKDNSNSSGVRMVLYTLSWELIQEHFFGVGTGDVKDVLYKKYEAYGFHNYIEKKYNPHSQFFQTFIALGFLGALLLIYVLIHPILWVKAYKQKEIFYLAIIIFISCAFESFLERQVGVIFFSFAAFLLVNPKALKKA
ncbi:O-antigen ligase family protein [Lishizhenia sp.]|uniref:O-antigen ligase family protein n=1 Tax=Lishizhenia sp. TaxID=2497594 RepID=UPI00299EA865|nr:O-antigen ligase family protein [Lishizhenia sp.]MDX1445542.1 O-antigen ligase family protein [Lishizhenia sp.]